MVKNSRSRTTVEFDPAGFHARLEGIVDGETQASFAKKVGISQAGLHRILKGGIPGLDVAFAIANAAGVTLDWLATGAGHAEVTESHAGVTTSTSLNLPVLYEVINALEGWLSETEGEMTPENKASAIQKIYDYVVEDAGHNPVNVHPKDIRRLLRLVV